MQCLVMIHLQTIIQNSQKELEKEQGNRIRLNKFLYH